MDMTGDLSSVEVMEKEDATFVCELSKPKQDVTWQIKGKKIKPNKKYEMSSDGKEYKLVIKDCQLSDAAEVSCIAKDCKSTAQLIVKGTHTQPSCMFGLRHKSLCNEFPSRQRPQLYNSNICHCGDKTSRVFLICCTSALHLHSLSFFLHHTVQFYFSFILHI